MTITRIIVSSAVLSSLLGTACTKGTGGEASPAVSAAATAPAPSSGASVSAAPSASSAPLPKDPKARAQALATRSIVIDGHIDVPYRLQMTLTADGGIGEDLGGRTEDGDFDYVRAKAGGLNAPFMSIYTPTRYENKGAKAHAEKLIAMVEEMVRRWPEKYALAKTPSDVRRNFAQGKISLPMGMENGAPIENDIDNVEYFYERGIRYITLAHYRNNHIADSSTDPKPQHGGLSNFGKVVVERMNDLGIMIDVSHISDDAVKDTLQVSKLPVIASHSAARHFTPGWKRNMSDELISKVAKAGGVVMINFGSSFLDDGIRKKRQVLSNELYGSAFKKKIKSGTPAWKKHVTEFNETHTGPYAKVEQVADHIQHVVDLAGIDHVGLGSDFDGVGDSLPVGLKDVSMYPNLLEVLLRRGFSDADIEKLCGKNLLRVWDAVERHAAKRRK